MSSIPINGILIVVKYANYCLSQYLLTIPGELASILCSDADLLFQIGAQSKTIKTTNIFLSSDINCNYTDF